MPEIVLAIYRPHQGKDGELRKLIAQHVPTLRRLELATDRKPIIMKSGNGTYVEVFEWASAEAVKQAHTHPEVAKVWEAMGKIADMPTMGQLEESKKQFAHFEPVNL